MPVKLLHFSDVHIGVENYGRVDPTTGLHTRLQDFVRSLEFVVETAIDREVDLALFAGDAYRTNDPTPTHQREFARQIRRLLKAGIPVVMVDGNRDIPVSFGRASALDIFRTLDLGNVHVASKPEVFRVVTRSGPVQVVCFPWPTRSLLLAKEEYKNLADEALTARVQEMGSHIIAGLAADLDPEVPAVLLAHLVAAEASYSGSERSAMLGRDPIFLRSTLAQPAFAYVALGHIHKHQNLNPQGHPPVVYCGSIERIDFGEEREDKGFCMVEIAKDRAEYEFVRTPARPFVTIEVVVPPGADPTEVLVREISRRSVQDAVVRVFYQLSSAEASLADMRQVYEALREAFLVSTVVPRLPENRVLRRADLSESLTTAEAMEKYIENHPELVPLKADLTEHASRLEQELAEMTADGRRRTAVNL